MEVNVKFKISLLTLLLVSLTVFSQTFELVVTNNSSVALGEVSIAPAGADFDYNYLDADLEPGKSATITFESSNDGNCVFDILAYGLDESSYLKLDLDLCQSQSISISDADLDGDNSGEEYAEEDNSGGGGSSDGSLSGKMTANKWKMMFNGEEYGSLKLKNDGSVVKTGSGGAMATTGTWSIDEANSTLTMDFPQEGAMTGKLKDLGGSFELVLYDGAIVWKLTKM